MNRILKLIWYWSLCILPFTSMITFIVTLVVCNQVLRNNNELNQDLPNISVLGTRSGYKYFVAGFVLLAAQFLLNLIGRLQYLCQSQFIINRIILYLIHLNGLIASIFMLIMAIVNLRQNGPLHVTAAITMFGFLGGYCILHTCAIFYLFIKRSQAPQYSNIFLPIWFLICSIVLIICVSIWVSNMPNSIPQYIAASMPFLYTIGFIPQFFKQARMEGESRVSSRQSNCSNDIAL
ncbi:unnamed protein product [Adineta steineri]|uniref:CWH43-like N-terminal domain-containing protein n=1 Tax=Adineta steineri TaxID=433720 RepID=A0A814D8E3_9BILA|nr:unnamed protein product [Adineta steineri]CAF0954796.1 unnamed protein product [Adineta steineri]CAF0959816.1 unnamed protein product [Adineta steineri]